MIDALAPAERLDRAGMEHRLAQGAAGAIRDALQGAYASKPSVGALGAGLQTDATRSNTPVRRPDHSGGEA